MRVLAATVVIALFSFGLGFYGIAVYLAALQHLHGWSASAVSAPVTVYYVAGAVLTAWMARAYAHFGPRAVVTVGTVAMAAGLSALGVVSEPWHLYPVFLVMAIGWGSMSGAALNILVAPWFVERRGLAVSVAFAGATLGGIVVAPALIPLIAALGFRRAVAAAALTMVAVLLPLAALVLRRAPATAGVAPAPRGPVLRTWRFWSVSAPFALGLVAQIGVLTHQVALLTPALGAGAARAVSLTMIAAMVGRLVTGVVVDRLSARLVASVTLVAQMAGVALLAGAESAPALYAGCVLFGVGVGNLTTLPGVIVAKEWPPERFAALVGLVVAINQFAFAFGPSLVGIARDVCGSYGPALALCVALQMAAAVLVLRGPRL